MCFFKDLVECGLKAVCIPKLYIPQSVSKRCFFCIFSFEVSTCIDPVPPPQLNLYVCSMLPKLLPYWNNMNVLK
jgi:hypothetical protein